MTKNDLQKFSQDVKKEANLLLRKTGLLNLLGKYGKVIIRGSYELDLMVARDIDIYVICENFKKSTATDALHTLIDENNFRGYSFYDFVKRRKTGFPKGYYVGLKTKLKGKKWDCDIWFLKSNSGVSDNLMKKIIPRLNDKNRSKIIELKQIILEKKKLIKEFDIPSYLIYLAVLEKDIKTFAELEAFVKNKLK